MVIACVTAVLPTRGSASYPWSWEVKHVLLQSGNAVVGPWQSPMPAEPARPVPMVVASGASGTAPCLAAIPDVYERGLTLQLGAGRSGRRARSTCGFT